MGLDPVCKWKWTPRRRRRNLSTAARPSTFVRKSARESLTASLSGTSTIPTAHRHGRIGQTLPHNSTACGVRPSSRYVSNTSTEPRGLAGA
jgi:hypothetical protein